MVRSGKIAYLLSQYPAVSHTFFLTELLGLRGLGFEIETASVNATTPPLDGFGDVELQERQQTFYLKSLPRRQMFGSLFKTLLLRPRVVWRGVVAALALRPTTTYILFYLVEALLLGEWMKRKHCTHLHIHFAGPVATVGMLASIAWQVPFSLSVHGPDDFYNVEKFYLQRKIEQAQFVCCISHFCRSQLIRLVPGEMWGKFHVCRLGVDTNLFRPSETVTNAETRVVSVGRLHPSKGQAVLLSSVRILRERGLQVKLDLVGGGSERPFLEQVITEAGLGSTVTLHGAMSHKNTRLLLQRADIFVLSSFAEGLPVALMEALASGTPSICSRIAGVPELITSSSEGLLVAPADEVGLANAIEQLIREPQLRRLMSEAGRARVLADYEVGKNSRLLAAVFRQHGLGRVVSA